MKQRQLVALCGTVVLAGGVAAGLGGFGSAGSEKNGARIADGRAVFVTASAASVAAPRPTALGSLTLPEAAIVEAAVPASPIPAQETPPVQVASADPGPVQDHGQQAAKSADAAAIDAAVPDAAVPPPDPAPVQVAALNTPDPEQDQAKGAVRFPEVAILDAPDSPTPPVQVAALNTPDPVQDQAKGAVSFPDVAILDAALPDSPVPAPPAPPEQVATANTPDPTPNEGEEAAKPVAPRDDCIGDTACVDMYLWSLYERTPKVDTIKVPEQIKVKVKKKGKTRTVTKTIFKLVDEDFAWKDPKAADKARMSLVDYVIGGMDAGFKMKLYRALRAMDLAGLVPGITSAFRDDYRQQIASGLKAATDRSYHGGSFRGGYGHGLAADIVSVKGDNRSQRYASTDVLWQWVDAHERELGIGRPYLDRDPPHVAPIDGKEYADHRSRAKTQVAKAQGAKAKAAKAAKAKVRVAKAEGAKAQGAKAKGAKAHVTTAKAKGAKAQAAKTKAQVAKAEGSKHPRSATRDDRGATKRAKAAKPSKVSSL
jgi:hypothetical protein